MAQKMNKKGKTKKPPTAQKSKRGMKPLSELEPTERATVNLPASMYAEVLRRANKRSISAYLRALVELDLKRAS